MTAFLVILGVPLLGVLLYVSEKLRVEGETPRGRQIGRMGLLLCGVVLALAGVYTLVATAQWILSGDAGGSFLFAIIAFLTRITAAALMTWSGVSAGRVLRLPLDEDDPSSVDEAHRERSTERLRLAAALLMFVPLLMLGVLGVVIAIPVVFWGVAFRSARQGRQAQFLWTMALAVRQDLPLAEEVEAFAQPLWTRSRQRYTSLADRLRDGVSLGEALELSTGILPRSQASEIRMAEEAGQLPEVLSDLATSSTRSLGRSRQDGSLAITFLYGWVLLVMFLFLGGFLMYWIVPKFKDIFADFGVELPEMTMSVIGASDFVVQYFYLVMPLIWLPILVGAMVAIVYFVNWSNLNFPLLMRWFPRLDAPALLRALSHTVGGDQPLPQLVEEMSLRHLRSDMRSRLARISNALHQGQPLWEPLQDERFIRPVEAEALAAAQRAGNLPWAMRNLAEAMDRSLRHRAQFWMELLKPAVVIGMGGLVGWFVIAMYLPLVHLISILAVW